MPRFLQQARKLAALPFATALLLSSHGASLAAAPPATASIGYDISLHECGTSAPPPGSFGVVGLNNGRPFTMNACAAAEFTWASQTSAQPALYLNTGYFPGYMQNIQPDCVAATPASLSGDQADAWAVGCSEGEYSVQRQPGTPATYWLDVEVDNSWSDNVELNRQTLQGLTDYLRQHTSASVGVYSDFGWWDEIAGGKGWTPNGISATWIAPPAATLADAAHYCAAQSSFAKAPLTLVQLIDPLPDVDYAC
ncbi:MAG: hypothetical protein JO247_09945 [Chloroflexi bacterium]|nr:hypothetical protein [Chloroflexota bacterium]